MVQYKGIELKPVDYSINSLKDLFLIEEKLQVLANPLIDPAYKKGLKELETEYLKSVKEYKSLNLSEDMEKEFVVTAGEIYKTEKFVYEQDYKKKMIDGGLFRELGEKILSNWEDLNLTPDEINSLEFQRAIMEAYQEFYSKKKLITN